MPLVLIECVSLRPTDEIAEDGWQFVISANDIDLTKFAQSDEFRVNNRMVNKFSEGRGFVVDDAARVHSPAGGRALIQLYKMLLETRIAETADKSLLETYSVERLPVISEMLQITTAIFNKVVKTDAMPVQSPIVTMLGINCRFSSTVLDEFAIPGKRINAYGILD
ncbi:hypothetical protein BDR07DRAFT_1461983 [Suillus spraguei]|nr:hypothetical protein BDR07DRAFT_1461983 [Suillus spraguei]